MAAEQPRATQPAEGQILEEAADGLHNHRFRSHLRLPGLSLLDEHQCSVASQVPSEGSKMSVLWQT